MPLLKQLLSLRRDILLTRATAHAQLRIQKEQFTAELLTSARYAESVLIGSRRRSSRRTVKMESSPRFFPALEFRLAFLSSSANMVGLALSEDIPLPTCRAGLDGQCRLRTA